MDRASKSVTESKKGTHSQRKSGSLKQKPGSTTDTASLSNKSVVQDSASAHVNRGQITTMCDIHPGEILELYCRQHDSVACVLCISKMHGKCDSVSVLDVSNQIRKGSLIENLDRKLPILYKFLQKRKHASTVNIQQIKTQKQEVKDEIFKLKSRLIKKIDELEEELMKKLDIEYKGCYVSISEDIEMYKEQKELVKTCQELLLSDKVHSTDPDLFCSVKLLEARR